MPLRQRNARWCGWTRQGVEEPLMAPPRGYLQPRLSPDALRVAVTIEDQGLDIWLWDIRSRALNQFTFDPASDQSPEWTRDGRRILFFSQREGGEGLYWQAADGVGEAERLGSGPPRV
jgi:TolB protein